MLNETEVHYLVALLAQTHEGSDVEVYVGNMIEDVASQSKRDVDITIMQTSSDGQVTAFKGLEVKKHTRKLGSPDIDGLCNKLRDMPEITHKAIVSATGYTKPAIRKAAYHHIDLYTISDWVNPHTEADFRVRFHKEVVKFLEDIIKWTEITLLRANFFQKDLHKIDKAAFASYVVRTYDDKEFGEHKTIQDLMHALPNIALAQLVDSGFRGVEDNGSVTIHIQLTERPCVKVDGELIEIDDFIITGSIETKTKNLQTHYKALRKVGEEAPTVGCMFVEMSNNSLFGVSVARASNRINGFNIPYEDRIKRKVTKQKLGNRLQ